MDSSSCKKEYKKLSMEFLKSEKFFYTKVYDSSRRHDSFIGKVKSLNPAQS